MGDTPLFVSAELENTTSLLTAYGPAADGWASNGVDVRGIDFLVAALTVVKGSATTLTLILEVSDRDGSVWYRSLRVDPDGVAVEDAMVLTLAADGKFAVRFDVRGVASVRLLAKVDTVTGTPTAVLILSAQSKGSNIPGLPLTN